MFLVPPPLRPLSPSPHSSPFTLTLTLHAHPHPQASEYKYEIARINKELRDVKKKYYDQKKREQQLQEVRRVETAAPRELLVQEARSTINRFTGGGFNLNMAAS